MSKVTKKTMINKLQDGLHSQGWRIIGIGGSWSQAIKPVLDYLKKNGIDITE